MVVAFITISVFVRDQLVISEQEKLQEQLLKTKQEETQIVGEGSQNGDIVGNEEQSQPVAAPEVINNETSDMNVEVYSKMGLEYENMEDFNKALEMYERSFEAENDINTLQRILDICMKLGYKDKMQEKINDYLSKNPSEAENLTKYIEFLN